MVDVSVIVPTYNERENLPVLAKRLDKAMGKAGISYELVVVDDNSPDGTAEVARNLKLEHGKVKVVVRKDERGLASAVMKGFEVAEGKYFVVMDADLQHPPEVVPELVKRLKEDCDLVIASRYSKEGRIEEWNFVRKVISKGATILAKLLVPATKYTTDPMSGFFALKREVVERAKLPLNPLGYKILLELLAKGSFEKVCEVPYVFGKRLAGESKLGGRVMLEYLIHLMKLAKETGELNRMLTFAAVGASGIVVNEGALYAVYELLGAKSLGALGLAAAGLAGFEASVVYNFLLHERVTFKDRRKGSVVKRFLHYEAASVLGAAAQLAFLLGLTYAGVHYLISNLIGIVVGLGIRYSYSATKAWPA
ncbi:glycosyl transferase, family 2 [Ignicoccus hospitalis KIN4/I]|uniref:Dolichol-phosphate mannosyltransferase n=1 Tax=Ignicoccus hospitalis (strain KIN4/I / DSM 18386 / JCM 14125) TaxID=453591 RepID=A8A9M1_IGNH4|nr:glycosyl transferase, family 2 [Ignicoccus hospitalis KIN4/I]